MCSKLAAFLASESAASLPSIPTKDNWFEFTGKFKEPLFKLELKDGINHSFRAVIALEESVYITNFLYLG